MQTLRVWQAACFVGIGFFALSSHAESDALLAPILVSGSSTSAQDPYGLSSSVSTLSGNALRRRSAPTLGETLARETGVSASQYGAGASRPVIRGLEGDRVRILQDNLGLLDASSASPDHAVAFDPLLVERVEILRGPGALRFGNSAVGGVVNVVTSRVPTERLLSGNTEVRARAEGSSADRGRSAGAVVKAQTDHVLLSADVTARAAEPYRAPGVGRVRNSDLGALSGGLGATYLFDPAASIPSLLGVGLSAYDTEYGSVADSDVRIQMDRQRADVVGRVSSQGFFESVELRSSYTRYKHEERERGAIATTFKNQGVESRLDARSRSERTTFDLGAQHLWSRLAVTGDEAFLPTTETSFGALFATLDHTMSAWTPSLGVRLEHQRVMSQDSSRMGAGATRTALTPSASAGVLYSVSRAWSLGVNATYTERLPSAQELFAQGAHVATGVYEQGDRNLERELSQSYELSLRYRTPNDPRHRFRITAFAQRFPRYIGLIPTGTTDGGSGLGIQAFRARRALFWGLEFEAKTAFERWDWEFRFDSLKARDQTSGTNLPRIAPIRSGLITGYRFGTARAEMELELIGAQNHPAPNESHTPGYARVHLGFEAPFELFGYAFRGRVRGVNLLDQRGLNAVSFVKDQAPLIGRNFILGIEALL